MTGSTQGQKATTAGLRLLLALCSLIAPGSIKSEAATMPFANISSENLIETSFAEIRGWAADDHGAALGAYLRFCTPSTRHFQEKSFGLDAEAAADLCRKAREVPEGDAEAARLFFEAQFAPYRIKSKGFVTGYFEPELPASRSKSENFAAPLLKAPEGLERVAKHDRPANWPEALSHGRRTKKGLEPLPDRGLIMDGALSGENLEFVWLANPVDAFFVHVQGSARLRLEDGSVMRVGYAGKTGHPYTSIARVLVDRGEGTPEDLTMAGLKQWLAQHPGQRDALLRENRSFIFFREVEIEHPDDGPIGAVNLPLIAGRSLAVDPEHLPFGAPVFVAADFAGFKDGETHFQRLMIADDTGSAIRGPARGDIFIGSGEEAGKIAGEIRHQADMVLLMPKSALR